MKKLNPYIGGLLAIAFVSIIGYLAVYSHIDFFKKKNSTLDVYIDKVSVMKSSAEVISKETYNGLSITLDVDLVSKEGQAIYSIDIKNNSEVSARLDDIKFDREKAKSIKYTYEDLKVDEVIEPNKVKTLKVVLDSYDTKNKQNSELKGKVDIMLTFVKSL